MTQYIKCYDLSRIILNIYCCSSTAKKKIHIFYNNVKQHLIIFYHEDDGNKNKAGKWVRSSVYKWVTDTHCSGWCHKFIFNDMNDVPLYTKNDLFTYDIL